MTRLTTLSMPPPFCCSISSSFSACFTVRGKPSRMKPVEGRRVCVDTSGELYDDGRPGACKTRRPSSKNAVSPNPDPHPP